jgi:3-oxoacyl-[acyl-carrier protein] reductase
MDHEGPVAVVTGAATGIGRAIALDLATRMSVACLDLDAEGNAETVELVAGAGGDALAIACDIADAEAVKAAFATIAERYGRVDLLVNNAAVWEDTSLTAGSYDEQCAAFARSIGSCSTGAFHCAAAAVALMGDRGGDIVNLVTEHVVEGRFITGYPASGYDCAKWSLWRLTETWAVELAPRAIRVNGLAFGATDTPMLRRVSVPLAESGMRGTDLADAVRRVVALGPDGPTGRLYEFGFTGTPRARSLEQIEAISTGS